MVRQYVQVTDTQRLELIRLIHQEGYSIAKASKVTGIPYDNAKAINRTYLRERRVHKINYRLRYQKKTLNVGANNLREEPKSDHSTTINGSSQNEKFMSSSHSSLTQSLPQQSSSLNQNYNYQGYPNTSDNLKLIPNSFQQQRQFQINQLRSQPALTLSACFPFLQQGHHQQQQQYIFPQIFRPIPQPNRGGLMAFPFAQVSINAQNYSKFFDFSNYSQKIIQRVTQISEPQATKEICLLQLRLKADLDPKLSKVWMEEKAKFEEKPWQEAKQRDDDRLLTLPK